MWTFEEEQGARYADLRTKQDIEKRLAEMQERRPSVYMEPGSAAKFLWFIFAVIWAVTFILAMRANFIGGLFAGGVLLLALKGMRNLHYGLAANQYQIFNMQSGMVMNPEHAKWRDERFTLEKMLNDPAYLKDIVEQQQLQDQQVQAANHA